MNTTFLTFEQYVEQQRNNSLRRIKAMSRLAWRRKLKGDTNFDGIPCCGVAYPNPSIEDSETTLFV